MSAEEVGKIRHLCPAVPGEALDLLASICVVGRQLELSEEEDLSEMGADMQMLTAAEMAAEAMDFYPGIDALPLGYLPLAKCLIGSGDPYFIKCPEGIIVRIPHEAARRPSLDQTQIETVATSLASLLAQATVEND